MIRQYDSVLINQLVDVREDTCLNLIDEGLTHQLKMGESWQQIVILTIGGGKLRQQMERLFLRG